MSSRLFGDSPKTETSQFMQSVIPIKSLVACKRNVIITLSREMSELRN